MDAAPRYDTDTDLSRVGLPHLPGCQAEDAGQVDRAVRHINATYHRRKLGLALDLGEYLLDTFFGGSSEAFKRYGDSHVSYRSLARHPDLRVSHSFLYVCVMVTVQSRVLPPDVLRSTLTVTHYKHLLAVKDTPTKVALARRAASQGWSTRRLMQAVAEWQTTQGARRRPGRPRLSMVEKSANLVSRGTRLLPQPDGVRDQVQTLTDDQVAALVRQLGPAMDRTQRLWDALIDEAALRGVEVAARA